jgi:hypothetical protein
VTAAVGAVAVAVGVDVLVGLGSPGVVMVADGVEVVVGDGVAGEDTDGKNGRHRARAVEARWRSAVIALCASVTRRCAWARPAPAPERTAGLAARAAVVGVAVATGVETGVAAVLPVPVVVLVVAAVLLWSDSRVAWALASDAVAEVSDLRSGAGSRVASAWPAVTVSPTETVTPETVPATAKVWLTWLTR